MGELMARGLQGPGRPASIPMTAYGTVHRLHSLGLGYRRIVRFLESEMVFTTKSSVYRLIHRLPPYQEVAEVSFKPDGPDA